MEMDSSKELRLKSLLGIIGLKEKNASKIKQILSI